MTPLLKDRVAVVTGAAQGLGLAFATALAAAGAAVILLDRDESALDLAVRQFREVSGPIAAFAAELGDPVQVEAVFGRALQEFKRFDVLVNNAGIFPTMPLAAMGYAHWREVISANLDSVFLCTQAVRPAMCAAGYGRIVNLASSTCFTGASGLAHYVAAKAGVIGFTRAAANELGPFGITVNAIAPGLTLTAGAKRNPDLVRAASERAKVRPIARQQVPDDLVSTLLYLTSPASAFVTGQTISVNGGEVKL